MGVAVTQVFRKILRRADGRKPQTLQTDNGKEFYDSTFQNSMKEKDIHYFSTTGDTRANVVKRFIRTLKGRMYHYFTNSTLPNI